MNRASDVAVNDYVATATPAELDDLERRIAEKRAALAAQAPRPEPLAIARKMCEAQA